MRILVGIDGSERGMQTLETAVNRARAAGDQLTIAVYTTTDSLAEVEASVRDTLDALEFDAPIQLIEENPGSRLVELAETNDYDRIVLPGGQQSPLGKIQLNSVLEFVLLNAHTTVTLVR